MGGRFAIAQALVVDVQSYAPKQVKNRSDRAMCMRRETFSNEERHGGRLLVTSPLSPLTLFVLIWLTWGASRSNVADGTLMRHQRPRSTLLGASCRWPRGSLSSCAVPNIFKTWSRVRLSRFFTKETDAAPASSLPVTRKSK